MKQSIIVPTEIRIGSVLKDKDGNLFTVDNVGQSGINFYTWSDTYYGNISSGTDYEYEYADVFPIELTEDVLRACGFEKCYESPYQVRYECKLIPNIEYGFNEVEKIHRLKFRSEYIECNYLHELQDAVRVLAKQELQIDLTKLK